jgi:UDP-N-acetylmuramoylalanine--D-glutamate ligase
MLVWVLGWFGMQQINIHVQHSCQKHPAQPPFRLVTMNDFKKFVKGKKITVMGLGLLGRGVGDIAFLAKFAKEIIVTDLKTEGQLKESLSKLKKFKNIKYVLGRHELKYFENRDFILKAAGVPLKSPFIAHAKKNKIPVYMSTALFAKFSPAKIIGITGTRGKTTVTYMIYETLKNRYKTGKVFLGGNIRGMSTIALLPRTKKRDVVVLELDSWQLQGFGDLKISPNISVFTTFMPDHLDYYGGKLKQYAHDKSQIFVYQKKGDVVVISKQAKLALKKFIKVPSRAVVVGSNKNLSLRIPGEHNQLNGALAYVVLKKLGIKNEQIENSLKNFKGVPGRLQFLKTIHGIKIYNDTTATTPHATVAAIQALGNGKNISLIIGGHDKKIDLKVLKKPIEKYCSFAAVLESSGGERLRKEKIISSIPHQYFSDFKKAVKSALENTPKNGILLLSTAFASFGMFKNEYDRGEQFEKIIKNL